MIERVEIEGFKCFLRFAADLRSLTLLTGRNNAGKSSMLQAILLCHLASRSTSRVVPLNGPLGLQLGAVGSVQRGDGIRVSLRSGGAAPYWRFEGEEEQRSLRVTERPEEAPASLMSLAYLAAERLGPRPFYRSAEGDEEQGAQVGVQGELTAHLLDAQGERSVDERLLHLSTGPHESPRLARQVELWMGELVPGIQIRTSRVPATGLVNLEVKVGGVKAEWQLPPSMGFGISYALPIVVAGLTTPAGGLLIVENPEAHLHPRGQSMMGRFLARVARAGVQVLVETHSDHFLNGMRLAAVRGEISPEDVSVLFFEKAGEAIRILIDADGALSQEPRYFFDQSEHDILAIVRERRHGR